MNPPRSTVNRRDLMRRAGISRRGSRPLEASPSSQAFRTADLMRARRSAMGSFFELCLAARTPGAMDLVEKALDRVESLEAQMTIYRDDSELSRVNATAHEAPVPVEAGLFELLSRAMAISNETGGAYDVTSGALSIAWGFVRGPRRVPDSEALADARQRLGMDHVRLDRVYRTVAFERPGIVLNLGSIGKGYAVDQAAAIVRDHWWHTGALVQAGQSSAYAQGSPPNSLAGRWAIRLRNPLDSEASLGTLWLRNRGLGTSGGAFQSFEVDGRTYTHILDPRTGEPAREGPLSVTVLAPTAADADALSTAFYLLGPQGAADYCKRHRDVSALFVVPSTSNPKRPAITLINLSFEDFDPEPGTEIVTRA